MENESRLGPLDAFLLNVTRYGSFAVFLLPFVVILSYLYPWVSGKIWGLEILVEILFPLYVLLAFRRKEYRPASNSLLYALLAWFAVITISAFLGDNLHRSMWSKPDRLTGLFFQYHLLAFFLMAGAVWRGKLRQIVITAVSAASLMAVIALFQALGGAEGGRGSGRLGNPSYLGQYLVPHVFLAAWLWWKDRASMTRIAWSICGILLLIGIYASKSKGALLGLFIGFVVAALLVAIRGNGKTRKWAQIGMAVLAGVVIAFFLANKWKPTAAWLYDNRLSIQYYQETSGSRKLLVANAVQTFKDHPLLGWGPENFESGYYYHYDPVTIKYSDYETRQDRPHNMVLELLANFGVIGLLAYAALIFFAVRLALQGGEGRRAEGGLLAVALVSQVAVNLFIFETPVSYIMFFVQLGLLAAFITPTLEPGEDDLKQGSVPAFLIVAAFALWALWYGVIGTIKAAKLTAQLIIASNQAEQVSADLYLASVDDLLAAKTPYRERDIRAVVSNLAVGRGQQRSDKLAPALEKLADAEVSRMEDNKNDFVFNLVVASSLMSVADRTTEQQAALETAMQRIKRLAPNRQEVYWYEATLLESKGDLRGAEASYRQALEHYPDSVAAQAQFATFYILHGKPDEAMAILKPSWPQVANSQEAQGALSSAFYRLLTEGRNEDVYKSFQAAEKAQIGTFEWYMGGTLAAMALGNEPEAVRIAEKAKTLWPEKKETIDQLMVQLREEIKRKKESPQKPLIQQ